MEDPWSILLIILLLISLSGFFSFFNVALSACRKQRIQKEISGPQKRRYEPVLYALENPVAIKISCHIWLNSLRVIAAFLAGYYIYLTQNILIPVYIAAIILVVILLGEALPRFFASIAPEKAAAAVLPLIKIFSFPLRLYL